MDTDEIHIPLDVPASYHAEYLQHYKIATHEGKGVIMLAGDQKVEHLNADFTGEHVDPSDIYPDHLFQIASSPEVSMFATQLGFIARYGMDFPDIPYLIKMNSKTNAQPLSDKDPLSTSWYSIEDVLRFKQTSGLSIVGIGFTVYIGSDYESRMLKEAAQLTLQAHQYGLISTLFMYPKGHSITDEKKPEYIIGAAATGAALGADLIKVNMPHIDSKPDYSALKNAVQTAGRSRIIIAGGTYDHAEHLLQEVYNQHARGDSFGVALGRNLHQRSLKEARTVLSGVYEMLVEGNSYEKALIHLSLS